MKEGMRTLGKEPCDLLEMLVLYILLCLFWSSLFLEVWIVIHLLCIFQSF